MIFFLPKMDENGLKMKEKWKIIYLYSIFLQFFINSFKSSLLFSLYLFQMTIYNFKKLNIFESISFFIDSK